MTNMLYLAIGIPGLLILSNTGAMFFLSSQINLRFEKQDSRTDRIEAGSDRSETRLHRIDAGLRHFFSIT